MSLEGLEGTWLASSKRAPTWNGLYLVLDIDLMADILHMV